MLLSSAGFIATCFITKTQQRLTNNGFANDGFKVPSLSTVQLGFVYHRLLFRGEGVTSFPAYELPLWCPFVTLLIFYKLIMLRHSALSEAIGKSTYYLLVDVPLNDNSIHRHFHDTECSNTQTIVVPRSPNQIANARALTIFIISITSMFTVYRYI
jgi:hypothetical protein